MSINLVADAHVDVLARMDHEKLSFYGESDLQASMNKLHYGGVMTQVFALFVHTHQSSDAQLRAVLRGIDIFHHDVIKNGMIRATTSKRTLAEARDHHELAAILSLEGGGCLGGDVRILRNLHQLGVRGMGLTWNHANELADGCREPRGGGLTQSGRDVVNELEKLSMWIDIAHLSDAGVGDIFKMTNGRVMASHANCRDVFSHPRNLTDETIREIIRRDGWMGLTFEASFVADEPVGMEDVFRHLDHVLSLGGECHIGFGSDFDGTMNAVQGLREASDYRHFANLVMARYGESLGQRILFQNFEDFLNKQLPEI